MILKKLNLLSQEEKIVKLIKQIVIQIVAQGSGHLGGSLSCTEMLYVLYHDYMGENQNDFILSKGHAVQAQYAVMRYFEKLTDKDLSTYGRYGTKLLHHPSIKVPGISYSSGALGNGLSVGIGMALSNNLDGNGRRVFIIVGDGELNEGTAWEGFMYAGAKKIPNLIVLLDWNGLQASDFTNNLIPTTPMLGAIRSLGWTVKTGDGHNVVEIRKLIKSSVNSQKPVLIALKTTKGKGISFAENVVSWHHRDFSADELKIAQKEFREE